MSSSIIWMIIGMGLATYLPRMLPLVALQNVQFPPFLERVLRNVPYAILGALIFPGVLFIQDGKLWYGIVGSVVAFFLAYRGINVVIVVIGSIIVLTVISFIIPV
ncbi:AzlD domain-containing protein [Fervidibacillus halotolerans]|uniref:AzlD domain-containing protein n=1 Tax=Fervidibacillus halotolerans TaxID=2980027 RepID=A0A9E8M145_9BACI|nr:AzlD domain-containing protein [Fervidibacillus halotolerans]WAA13027.1 AzlD domain-containing protein [Fervidibacillus halotolerans]